MGRQRSKKLKFVDPFYSGPRPDIQDSHKHNLKPSNPEDQPVPNKMKSLFTAPLLKRQAKPVASELQNDTIQPAVVRKRGAVRGTEEDGRKGLETSSFKRAKGESAKRFLERVDRETNDQLMEHYRKSKQKSSKKKLYDSRRKEKAQWKKKGGSVEGLKEIQEDRVRFGETVQEPPHLTSKPRKAKETSKAQKALSLKLVHDNPDVKMAIDCSTKQGTDPHKKKRKSIEDQRRQQELEVERQRVVEVYRMKKKMKTLQSNKAVL